MAMGKWHLGNQPPFLPIRHGFDHYLGLPYLNDMGGASKNKGNWRPPLPLLETPVIRPPPIKTRSPRVIPRKR